MNIADAQNLAGPDRPHIRQDTRGNQCVVLAHGAFRANRQPVGADQKPKVGADEHVTLGAGPAPTAPIVRENRLQMRRDRQLPIVEIPADNPADGLQSIVTGDHAIARCKTPRRVFRPARSLCKFRS